MFGVLYVEWMEHLFQRVKKCVVDVAAAVPWPLRQSQKVFHKHIHIRQEFRIVSP